MPSPYEYPSLGKCLYCAETDNLTKEHIIPQSLGGRFYLTDGSCLACAEITKKFECIFAQKMYWPLRLKLGIRGKRRKKSQRVTHLPVSFTDDDGDHVFSIPVGELPSVYAVPELPPAGILVGEKPRDTNPEMTLRLKGNPAEMGRFTEALGAGRLQTDHLIDWNAFNRVLAKIAHAYTIANFGFDGLEPLLVPIIRGDDGHFPYFIGGVLDHDLQPPNELEICFRYPAGIEADLDFIAVRIGLFGGRFPTYEVVSARVTNMDKLLTKICDARVG